LRDALGARFASRARAEWLAVFAGTEACVTPVLTLAEAMADPHHAARGTYPGGEPAPAPRLSRTPGAVRGPAPSPGAHTRTVLRSCGLDDADIEAMFRDGVAGDLDEFLGS
jgi:alpha-methylacyl-CoA racemase